MMRLLCFSGKILFFIAVLFFLKHLSTPTVSSLRVFHLWLFELCLFLSLNTLLTLHFSHLWVAAAGLAALASDLPWGHDHFLCALLPFLLLRAVLIPLAALCQTACYLPAARNDFYNENYDLMNIIFLFFPPRHL